MTTLKDRVMVITGASRGIGKAIALRAAADGAKVVVAAKTTDPHPKLPGTIFSAAEEIIAAGGEALAVQVDIRFEDQIEDMVNQTVARFGGIDILINNASAIFLAGTEQTPAKRFDLMHAVNVRGTFLCSQKCLPFLRKSQAAHLLNISPPLNLDPQWFKDHVAYTMAKYGMSMCVLGMSEELAASGINVNALWPKTAIATAAVKNLLGGDDAIRCCRKPEIMADAAYQILTTDGSCTGNFFIDEELLRARGVEDFDVYAVDSSTELMPDFFV